LVERAIDDREATAAYLAIDSIIEQRITAGERLVVGGHRGRMGGGSCARTMSDRKSRARTPRLPCARSAERIHSPDADVRCKGESANERRVFARFFIMILSMTGFASASAELPGISLAVELRSVNHRYLDVTIRLPDELRMLEPSLRERLANAQKRGKVECRVSLARTVGAAGMIAINSERVEQLATVAAGVARAIPGTPPLTTADILRWPGVMVDASVSAEALAEQVDALVQQALSELTSARAREGAKLREVLDARCADLETQVARVAPRIPALHAAFLGKLGARLAEAG